MTHVSFSQARLRALVARHQGGGRQTGIADREDFRAERSSATRSKHERGYSALSPIALISFV
jgi:hypothetical protein